MNWFGRALAQRPLLVLTAVGALAITCLVVPLTTRKFPDFTDPTLGFEARGTGLAQRLTAWENLLESTRPSGSLTVNPTELIPHRNIGRRRYKPRKNKKTKNKIKKIKQLRRNNYTSEFENYGDKTGNSSISLDSNVTEHDHWGYGKNHSFMPDENLDNITIDYRRNQWKTLLNFNVPEVKHNRKHFGDDEFFCGSPTSQYSHMVFSLRKQIDNIDESIQPNTLFTASTLRSMCEIEQLLIRAPHYDELCQMDNDLQHCCRPWSLHNYVTLLSGKTNCSQITDSDVNRTVDLLQDCARFYHGLQLTPDCAVNEFCQGVPSRCTKYNAVYNIFYYLADVGFLPPNESYSTTLQYAMIFLPVASSTNALSYYNNLPELVMDNIEVIAMDLGIKSALFDEYLLSDAWLIGLGAVTVFSCMWMYTKSLFLTLMALTAVVFSLGISYFCYTLLFELNFFPFMNLLAIVVAVGIGADDAFILVKTWQSERVLISEDLSYAANIPVQTISKSLSSVLSRTLQHSAISMLVTSLTTAVAFYASYISSITAVRCFGIFAGTAVLANYLLVITWLPAALSLTERYTFSLKIFKWSPLHYCSTLATSAEASLTYFGQGFERVVVGGVEKFKWAWLVGLGAIAIGSAVVVLYYPQFKLPDSPDFQLFDTNHPFEQYDIKFKDKFWFERLTNLGFESKLPLRFVWGVIPVDTGNYLDPSSRGLLTMDDSFNISLKESQTFLLKFCRRLRAQPFYQSTLGPLLPNCFIENFITWMERRCMDITGEIDRSPCCEASTFPFESHVFDACLVLAISDLYETSREYFTPGVAGPKFSKPIITSKDNITDEISLSLVRAAVVEFESNVSFTMSYAEMHNFYVMVDEWTVQEMENAPPGMKGGWFISHLDFYDLQDTLSKGTLMAIAVSMAIALVVLLLVTLNILISLYAIITVTCSIFVTVAFLVLLGWKLNVLESIAVSTAIGLAVDFSLHYGVHYRLAPEVHSCDRSVNTRYALLRMCGPTAMAALTTLAAGAFMLPSRVLAYIKIGAFLVVVMTVSWLYSTFFLGSLLYVAGPQRGFCQFQYPSIRTYHGKHKRGDIMSNGGCTTARRRCDDQADHMYDVGHVMSEHSLSGCSTTVLSGISNSESHELEALTGKANGSLQSNTKKPQTHVKFSRSVSAPTCPFHDQSPSGVSAITVILADDFDELRPRS